LLVALHLNVYPLSDNKKGRSMSKRDSYPVDLTFITNENGKTLKDRFIELIKDCQTFDCIVAYFKVTGFYQIYKALENAEKIRILVGIGTDKETFDLIESAKENNSFSHPETKEQISEIIQKEFEFSEDKKESEEGVLKFIEWIKQGKIEIRAKNIFKLKEMRI
jgi:hypothetical protein